MCKTTEKLLWRSALWLLHYFKLNWQIIGGNALSMNQRLILYSRDVVNRHDPAVTKPLKIVIISFVVGFYLFVSALRDQEKWCWIVISLCDSGIIKLSCRSLRQRRKTWTSIVTLFKYAKLIAAGTKLEMIAKETCPIENVFLRPEKSERAKEKFSLSTDDVC